MPWHSWLPWEPLCPHVEALDPPYYQSVKVDAMPAGDPLETPFGPTSAFKFPTRLISKSLNPAAFLTTITIYMFIEPKMARIRQGGPE